MPNRLSSEAIPCYFRASVGMALLSARSRVLMARRAGNGRWQLPQGGIEPGETPLEAARRELSEELGVPPPRLAEATALLGEHPDWLTYELPEPLRTARHGRGQTQRWFYFRFHGQEAELDSGIRDRSGEFDAWSWTTFEELIRIAWEPKRRVYESVRAHLHVLER